MSTVVGGKAVTAELARLRTGWGRASLDEVVVAAERWVTHPCAAHRVEVAEVWWDTGVRLRDGDRFGEAAEVFARAIHAGYRSWPLPETDIAECWLRAGRRQDAERLYTEVRAREPRDLWLYRAAGSAYTLVGDPATAVDWFTAGIELALSIGDPEQLIGSLDEARTTARVALGHRDEDELSVRVARFET